MAPPEPTAEGGGANVRVRIDHDSCSGTSHCQQSMPEVFVVINRKSWIRPDVDWAAVDLPRLQHAVDACPWFAISMPGLAERQSEGI